MNKKIMATFAVLMIALSVAGFAYAHWSDYVKIEGTVHMGELIVGWYNTTGYLFEWNETTNGVREDLFNPPKPWICNATINLSEEETSVHHVPPETVYHNMTVTIDNAYPQWDLHVKGWLKNAGTIPATYCNTVFTAGSGYEWYEEAWYYDNTIDAWIWRGVYRNSTDPTIEIMNVNMTAYTPEDGQLEPCSEYKILIDLDFKQTAEECHTYTFSVLFNFVQWNKAP